MKNLIIYSIIISVCVVILTNLITATVAVMITSNYLDYKYGQYLSGLDKQTEDDMLNAVRRTCVRATGDNTVCNKMARSIYHLYLDDLVPLPGFDVPFIREIEEEAY